MPVQGDLALVVGRAAAEQQPILPDRLERRRRPEIQRVDRLHVVMAVEQDGWLAGRFEPVGVDDRVPGCLDHLGILEAHPFVLLGQVARGAANVIGTLRAARDARDPQKILEFLEALLPSLFQEFLSRGHRDLSSR